MPTVNVKRKGEGTRKRKIGRTSIEKAPCPGGGGKVRNADREKRSSRGRGGSQRRKDSSTAGDEGKGKKEEKEQR